MALSDPVRVSPVTLLRALVLLAAATLVLGGLVTVTIVRLKSQSASQSQLARLQADSCHVFSFVSLRFLKPTKSTTAEQRQITAQFSADLQKAVSDCRRAGYAP